MKQLAILFLALVLLLAPTTVPALAADDAFVIQDGILTGYMGPGGDVTIPDGVIRIGEEAFADCAELVRVTIPESVRAIDDKAFSGCVNLRAVTIPTGVTRIGWSAFRNCTSLTDVTIPSGVQEIGYAAFSGCSALKCVTLPASISGIDYGVFDGCSALTDVYFSGIRERWDALEIDDPPLKNARLHFQKMTDIEAHPAYDSIIFCMAKGFFSGVSASKFDPEGTLTRAMFVTVLGRMLGIDEAVYKEQDSWSLPYLFTDVPVNAWYGPYLSWAVESGIIKGVSANQFAPDDAITREQVATILLRWCDFYGYALSGGAAQDQAFRDAADISAYARDAVEACRAHGIIPGLPNGDGSVRFAPRAAITRAQSAVSLHRLQESITEVQDDGKNSGYDDYRRFFKLFWTPFQELRVPCGASWSVNELFNFQEGDVPVLFSTDSSVFRIVDEKLCALAPGEAELGAFCIGYHIQKLHITVVAAEDYVPDNYWEKSLLVFEKLVDDPRAELSGGGSYLKAVNIRVWDFADSTQTNKITKHYTINVNKNIAYLVEKVFEEIYNGPEQFPISAIGGYSEAGHSEHTPGLAIDINPYSNYMIDGDTVAAGHHWNPEEDPYSIPLGGDVDKAFAHYGFYRGFWGYRMDFMHYSFFGK